MTPRSSVPARLCVAGGLIGVAGGLVTAFVPPAVADTRYSYPYTPRAFVVAQLVFMLNHVLLVAGVVDLGRSGALGDRRYGRAGVWAAVAGLAGLTLCEVRALSFADDAYPSPGTATLDALFGVTTMLIGAGLVTAGLAVVRSRAWTGWARWAPLACGVAVFVVVIPGLLTGFLGGRLAITTWMVLFTALGAALARDAGGAPAPRRLLAFGEATS